jgi:ankyrin repeat protein
VYVYHVLSDPSFGVCAHVLSDTFFLYIVCLTLALSQVVLKLLEDGAPFVIDSDGQTALHQAAAGGHADTVAALILGGCDASVQDFVSSFLFLY